MNSAFSRAARAAFRNTKRVGSKNQKRSFGSAENPEEAKAGMLQWKKLSIACSVPVIAWAVYTWFHEEHFPEHLPYPHLHMRTKRFPWSDGERELFALAGNKMGHYYPQYSVEQPGAKKEHH